MKCEIFANVYLPAIRSILAKELLSKGFSKKDIADRLYLSKSAISLYLRNRRGLSFKELEENEKALEEIKKLVNTLSTRKLSKKELDEEFCKICKIIL